MYFNRARTDAECGGNLAVLLPLDYQIKDFAFARCQGVQPQFALIGALHFLSLRDIEIKCGIDSDKHGFRIDRFFKVIDGAGFECATHGRHVAMCGHENHR